MNGPAVNMRGTVVAVIAELGGIHSSLWTEAYSSIYSGHWNDAFE
jgi:hypothetical protein